MPFELKNFFLLLTTFFPKTEKRRNLIKKNIAFCLAAKAWALFDRGITFIVNNSIWMMFHFWWRRFSIYYYFLRLFFIFIILFRICRNGGLVKCQELSLLYCKCHSWNDIIHVTWTVYIVGMWIPSNAFIAPAAVHFICLHLIFGRWFSIEKKKWYEILCGKKN